MKKEFLLFAVLFSCVLPIRAFEGTRLPIVIGIQSQGQTSYKALIERMSTVLSDVVSDQSFIFRDLSMEDLADYKQINELDYLFSSATVFAALQHYAGFSPVASVMPTLSSSPNHANALTLVVRNRNKSIRTMRDVESCEIALLKGGSPDIPIFLKEEFIVRGIQTKHPIVMRELDASTPDELLSNFAKHDDHVCALALDTALGVDDQALVAHDLRVLEPRLNDDLEIAHTSSTYPGWVLSANYKVDREAAMRLGALLRTLAPHSNWQWSIPADFRSMHTFLQRSDPFYTAFKPRTISDYLKDHQSLVIAVVLGFIAIVFHILRTGHLLRKRTRELTLANEARLENEKRFHLLEKQNIVGQLSSIVAHEIRQPLAAVSNYAMALRRRYENQDLNETTLAYGLNRLVAESARANEIIDYVQKYVRTSEKNKIWLDLSKQLNEIVHTYIDSTGTPLVALIVTDGTKYYMDAMDLNLMVRNLIKNALEASRAIPNAKVEIACAPTADQGLSINVLDVGPALSDEAFRKLSQPLNSTKIDGLGLGLSIVRLIAESYGGHIEFTRRTPSGLSVTIVLPPVSEQQHS